MAYLTQHAHTIHKNHLANENPHTEQGQRLGTGVKDGRQKYEDNPKPIVNKNLTQQERDQIRAERAAAAEARAKKNKIGGGKKKKAYASTDLKGPNTKNTMSWTV